MMHRATHSPYPLFLEVVCMLDDLTVKTVWMFAESGLLLLGIYYVRRFARALEKLAEVLERR